MKKIIRDEKKRIIGFIYQDTTGQHWYAFGKPSQREYISFACRSFEHGQACIEMYRPMGHY